MENYESVRKKIKRHIRYVYSKDSKRKLLYYGLTPSESVVSVSTTITDLVELRLALASLSQLELMIIQCNVIGSETIRSIAHRLNLSDATVKRKKKEAIHKLREYLE